jgi:hypothetical protein
MTEEFIREFSQANREAAASANLTNGHHNAEPVSAQIPADAE